MRPFAAVFLLLALALGACGGARPPEPSAGPRLEGDRIVYPENAGELAALSVAAAEPAPPGAIRTTGRLAWDEEATARVYPPVGGRVRRMLATISQRVGPGSPLAAIESPDFGQAQADAQRAATDLAAAQRNFDRVRELFEHNAAAKKDLDAAEADQARSRAESARTRSRLALLGGSLGTVDQRFILRSPIGGIVVDRAINPGLEVRTDTQTPLFVISDPARLWVFLDVTERDLARVRPGLSLALRSAAYPDRAFAGRVDLVGDTLDPATRTVKARGRLRNPDRLLKAEMYVDVDISDPGERPGIQVPSAAIVAEGKQRYVFVEEGRGRFQRRPVVAGPERAGKTQILAGVAPGQRVVVDGSLLLESLLSSRG